MPTVRALLRNAVFDRVPRLVRRGPRGHRRVALTFDDGPDELTPRYLDVLDTLGIPATFFLVGHAAEQRPELVRQYVRRGHQIASHGHDHARFSTLPRRVLLDQCRRTEAALAGQPTGSPWIRPPHGTLDARSTLTLLAAGYTVALWSLDSLDHSDRDPDAITRRCSPPNVEPGEVLLFHEGQPWTLEAVPRVVAALHAAGYECVTMADLLAS
jgi:peptidoglycan-N-acetylglucosamine deacetylase